MVTKRTQRIRDPVHGLIAFRKEHPLDQLAWSLLGTPEFQRLRRIKQLGVAEFVFPSATHTRFAHSIGVFHIARTLIEVIRREKGGQLDDTRADVAVIAALLHDVGHGPFSHTFETVQKLRGAGKRHEQWSADIIRNPDGAIRVLLDEFRAGFCDEVAKLLLADEPSDIYHAVVSSSFDADRLDYLRRDRLMTGTGAGAIDFDWLIEHIRVGSVSIDAADDSEHYEQMEVETFCLDSKALAAAEQFLLARYTLHDQIYFHKVTRCVEHMIAKLLRLLSKSAISDIYETGLSENHPLVRFFGTVTPTLKDYLALDDTVIISALDSLSLANNFRIKSLATRLRNRDLYKTLDLREFGGDEGKQGQHSRRIDRIFKNELAPESETVLKDPYAAISIYTQIGGDDEEVHKKLHILHNADGPKEITQFSKIVEALGEKKPFTRYYFENAHDRTKARDFKKPETK